ncbi:F-box protein At5g39250 isoform X2 [Nymphaea colorata]|nr:F-box protein At5g39250 isoform X2 [Nymphaea colorata]
MSKDWPYEVILKAVFPLLSGSDLAACMCVCRQWRDIGRDEYFWKGLCAERWPSICKKSSPPPFGYYKLYLTFCKKQPPRPLLPPNLSFTNLEFYIDVWSDEKLVFSEVVPGPILQAGIKNPPPGISDVLRLRLEGPGYKMMMAIDPWFPMVQSESISASVLVSRQDTKKLARIINKSSFDYVDGMGRAFAYDYLEFSPLHPFISGIRAWLSLLLMEDGDGGNVVFGIEMDFFDAANSEDEVLWLLDMLDWK